jgi:DNA primase
VSLSKNCWICFGDCNGGGSIIDFVSRKEGVGIREAALQIQDWFNVQPPNGNSSQLRDACLAAGTREPQVASSDVTARPEFNPPLRFTLRNLNPTHPYLANRGLAPATVREFGLGYCRLGRLAGRIVIPIHNGEGELVAYAGRWAGEPPEDTPKYLLLRGFRKSLEIFNLHRAKGEDPKAPLVVVEGYFACIKAWQAGVRRVVSPMGSMVSQRQIQLLIEAAGPEGEVILAFDEDEAGRKGRREAQARLGQQVQVKLVRFAVEGTQPDHLVPGEFIELLNQARPSATP